ncbi:hypothetical protein PENTCL1PPCAC_24537, partial [Pristionchus entomophagus]
LQHMFKPGSEAAKRRASLSSPAPSPQFRSPLTKANSESGLRSKKPKLNQALASLATPREDIMDPMRFEVVDDIRKKLEDARLSHEEMLSKLLHQPFRIPIPGYSLSGRPLGARSGGRKCSLFDPYAEGAVVLYAPPQAATAHEEMMMAKSKDVEIHVVVDPILGRVLRPHQKEGVRFMYDCVTGRAIEKFNGCIMADEMGLGKTLQCISLMWTLLRQSPKGEPEISKAIIVCPSSLVKNWDDEIRKWLGERVGTLRIDSGGGSNIKASISTWMMDTRKRVAAPVLILSYECFRMYAEVLHKGEVGLIICDEGHRLKNSENQTYKALSLVKCAKRVLISGTPIQNDLLEYLSLLNFVNPGLLGTTAEFKKKFENVILRGRDSEATEEQQKKGNAATTEMAVIASKCVIRRTSTLLTKYLPVKYEHVVCCRPQSLQEEIYARLMELEKKSRSSAEKGVNSALAFITLLKKLCNHPTLLRDEFAKENSRFAAVASMLDGIGKAFEVSLSGKMKVLDCLLAITKKTTTDRFVLVSNYTQTIDQFVELCRIRGYGFVRLDGSMTTKQRAKIVKEFNEPESAIFCFLLSSKAGGCGLNLIGANRLVMFDPDWNPANDEQAMARVWRDGQKKNCFIYRLLTTGSIEEKMFQRQTHKKALSSCVVDAEEAERHFSSEQLRELFVHVKETTSDTHDKLKCKRCVNGLESVDPPLNADCSSDLSLWMHSQKDVRKVADTVLRTVYSTGAISFVFHQRSHDQTAKEEKKKEDEAEEEEKDEEEIEKEGDSDYEP